MTTSSQSNSPLQVTREAGGCCSWPVKRQDYKRKQAAVNCLISEVIVKEANLQGKKTTKSMIQ